MPIGNLLLLLPANPTAESRRRAGVKPPQPPVHRRGDTPDPPAVPPAGAEARWLIMREDAVESTRHVLRLWRADGCEADSARLSRSTQHGRAMAAYLKMLRGFCT